MQKKKLLCIASLLLLSAMVCYQTAAYYTASTTTTNVLSTGQVVMKLYETIPDGSDGTTTLDEGESAADTIKILPGDTVSQVPYVENTGSEDFYTRVSVTVSVVKDGETEAVSPEVAQTLVSLNIDETKWVLDSEGWYRYTDIVAAGATTADPLFTEVSFLPALDNDYIDCTITITVDSQSVQAAYNTYDEASGSVLDVQGWPTEEGSTRG